MFLLPLVLTEQLCYLRQYASCIFTSKMTKNVYNKCSVNSQIKYVSLFRPREELENAYDSRRIR